MGPGGGRGARPLTFGKWDQPDVVRGFAAGAPNGALLAYARAEMARVPGLRVADIGCGAARNASPMAALGARVVGTDLARPMLEAAVRRAAADGVAGRTLFVHAAMDALPLAGGGTDLVVAHGIWNLARSGEEMRRAMAEAARVARPGAGLFVFTFSRNTLPADARAVAGETFVFTQFSGEPQCFLTEGQLVAELRAVGFEKDPPGPMTEHNRPAPGLALARGAPVVYEGTFRRGANPPSGR